MKTYTIFLKKGGSVTVQAESYSEDPEKNKLYFHKSPTKDDKTSFFVLSEVVGIDVVIDEAHNEISFDAINAGLKNLLKPATEAGFVVSQPKGQ